MFKRVYFMSSKMRSKCGSTSNYSATATIKSWLPNPIKALEVLEDHSKNKHRESEAFKDEKEMSIVCFSRIS